MWINKRKGDIKDSANRRLYVKILEENLKKVDGKLFEKDNSYFWGGMLESIEFGIIGQ